MKKKFFAKLLVLSILFTPLFGTPMDDYVRHNDGYYNWSLSDKVEHDDYTFYSLRLTSQKWLDESKVDKPIWNHWLSVIVPKKVSCSSAMLFICGGSNHSEQPLEPGNIALDWALDQESVVATVSNVPNQPLVFSDEADERYVTNGRVEDGIVVYTWDKFLENNDAEWLIRLPMTKAVVKAMDSVQEFTKKNCRLNIKKFHVAGFSKRGWSAWTTAAVDKRVETVIPIVIDLLNMKTSFEHHLEAYGFYSPAIQDYIDMKIVDRRNHPRFSDLVKIIEPYHYRERFTMPKYIVNSAGDEFFLPDSSRFYFHKLPSKKYLRYIPNSSHDLKGTDYHKSIGTFYSAVSKKEKLPQFTWTFQNNKLIVTSKTKPMEVTLWKASNPNARDFRMRMIGKAWEAEKLSLQKKNTYTIDVVEPEKGWSAYFVELKYPSKGGEPFVFTTDIFVTPSTLPFSPKHQKETS